MHRSRKSGWASEMIALARSAMSDIYGVEKAPVIVRHLTQI
jgi:hypothetical protein